MKLFIDKNKDRELENNFKLQYQFTIFTSTDSKRNLINCWKNNHTYEN